MISKQLQTIIANSIDIDSELAEKLSNLRTFLNTEWKWIVKYEDRYSLMNTVNHDIYNVLYSGRNDNDYFLHVQKKPEHIEQEVFNATDKFRDEVTIIKTVQFLLHLSKQKLVKIEELI